MALMNFDRLAGIGKKNSENPYIKKLRTMTGLINYEAHFAVLHPILHNVVEQDFSLQSLTRIL
jgi:hypothetical protein